MDALRIVAVSPQSPEFGAFLDFPWTIYPGRVAWVPPLKAGVAFELSEGNLFFQHGEAQPFLCLRGEEPVGRIVASVDRALVDQTVGHFGYFEAIDDPAVARLLLETAEAWVRERGRTQLHGPINLSIFQQYRIQTDGFETRPFFGEPRTPAYYQALLEGAGYSSHARWSSWDIPGEAFGPFFEALRAKGERRQERLSAYTIAPFDLSRFEEECRGLYPIICETFQENYGYTQISFEEFLQRFADAQHIMSVGASNKALDADGKLVAYSYTYTDVADNFIAANGDHTQLQLAEKAPEAPLVCHTFGILREHRNVGIAERLFEVGVPEAIAHHRHAIGAVAKERLLIYARFGPASRRYAVYARSLA